MVMEFQCPITQETMDKALDELRGEGVLIPSSDGEDIDHRKLRDYCIKATLKLTDAERVALVCISGLCACEEEDSEK